MKFFAFWFGFDGTKEKSIKKMLIKEYEYDLDELDRCIEYMSSTENMLNGGSGSDPCLFDNAHILYGYGCRTDGVWIWESHMDHYIREHNIQIPRDFIEHMKANNFVVPKLSEDELDNIIEDHWPIIRYGIGFYPYISEFVYNSVGTNTTFSFDKLSKEKYKDFA